jgi:hypothetical protein
MLLFLNASRFKMLLFLDASRFKMFLFSGWSEPFHHRLRLRLSLPRVPVDRQVNFLPKQSHRCTIFGFWAKSLKGVLGVTRDSNGGPLFRVSLHFYNQTFQILTFFPPPPVCKKEKNTTFEKILNVTLEISNFYFFISKTLIYTANSNNKLKFIQFETI